MLTAHFLRAWLVAHGREEQGGGIVEYALLVALIAVACILAITFLGEATSSKFSIVGDSINSG